MCLVQCVFRVVQASFECRQYDVGRPAICCATIYAGNLLCHFQTATPAGKCCMIPAMGSGCLVVYRNVTLNTSFPTSDQIPATTSTLQCTHTSTHIHTHKTAGRQGRTVSVGVLAHLYCTSIQVHAASHALFIALRVAPNNTTTNM